MDSLATRNSVNASINNDHMQPLMAWFDLAWLPGMLLKRDSRALVTTTAHYYLHGVGDGV